jgi:hypothetical protein
MLLYPCQNFLGEEGVNRLGANGMELVADRYANALLALAHAEGSAQINLVCEVVLCDQILKLLNDLTGSLDVAGATDTNSDFQHDKLPLLSCFFRCDLSSLLSQRGHKYSIINIIAQKNRQIKVFDSFSLCKIYKYVLKSGRICFSGFE